MKSMSPGKEGYALNCIPFRLIGRSWCYILKTFEYHVGIKHLLI